MTVGAGREGREPEVEHAARMVLVGMDPYRFLATKDQVEALVLIGVADRAFELQQQRDENLAQLIANRVAEAFSG